MDARLQVRLLGAPEASLDGQRVTGLKLRKTQALLYLLASHGGPVRRSILTGLLWCDLPEAAASANLRKNLFELRRALGDLLDVERETVALRRGDAVWVDRSEFVARADARRARDAGQLEEAIGLYRGDFLAGFHVHDAPEFEHWVAAERTRLRELALTSLHMLTVCTAEAGDLAHAIAHARHAVALEPWREEAHCDLMRLLARDGQRSAALAQYEICRRALAEELDVAPGAETEQVIASIRDGTLGPDAVRQSSDAAPVVVAQGRPTDHRPVRPPDMLRVPAQATPCVGRGREIAQLTGLLADPAARLITVTGAGGMGKTRLALAVAQRLLDDVSMPASATAGVAEAAPFGDGIFFVALAPISESSQLAPTIAAALSFRPGPAVGRGGADEQLRDYLAGKRLLLVLDNYEQLAQEGAAWLAELLRAAPGVKALVTSREPLELEGEQRYPIEGLAVPDLEAVLPDQPLHGENALTLFQQVARRVQYSFRLTAANALHVARICRLVGGMPLAIQLAASWAALLSPAEIAAEIAADLRFLSTSRRDLPERHRSLVAVIEPSWRRLSETDQDAFSRLCLCRGGVTRADAQALTGCDLATLARLQQHAFLQYASDSGRYQIHEVLRQYGEEKLDADPGRGEAARGQHAAYYMRALARWAAALKGPRQTDALIEMDAEIANVQAAWAWAVRHGAAEQLAEGMEGFGLYYFWRSPRQAGEEAVQAAADALAERNRPQPALVQQARAGLLAWRIALASGHLQVDLAEETLPQITALLDEAAQGGADVRRTRAFALQVAAGPFNGLQPYYLWTLSVVPGELDPFLTSLGLWQAVNDLWGAANALCCLGVQAWSAGQADEAVRRHEECLAIRRRLGAPREIVGSLLELSWDLPYAQPARVEALQREALALARSLGDPVTLAWVLVRLAMMARHRGEGLAAALPLIEESFAIHDGLGDRQGQARTLLVAGYLHLSLGHYPQAQAALRQSRDLYHAIGNMWDEGVALASLGSVALCQGESAEAYRLIEQGIAAMMKGKIRDVVPEAYARLSIAALRLGDCDLARRHLVVSLRTATRQTLRQVVYALPGAMLLTLAEGQTELAVELHALALRYPFIANGVHLRDLMDGPVAAAAAGLPPAVVAAAEQRGRERNYHSTLETLLAEWDR